MIQSWPRLATTDTAPTTWLSPRRTGSEMTISGSRTETERSGWLIMALPCRLRSTPSCSSWSSTGSCSLWPARAPVPWVSTTLTE